MRFLVFLMITALSASAVVTGCNQTATSSNQASAPATNAANPSKPAANAGQSTTTASQPQAEVERISVQNAKSEVDSGKAVIIDVRGTEAYNQKHIKGSIDMKDVAANYEKLPKDKKLIFYCS